MGRLERYRRAMRLKMADILDASETASLAAEGDLLRLLVGYESKYAKTIADLLVRGDKDSFELQEATRRLRTVQAEIDNLLVRNSEAWAKNYLRAGYLRGRETVGLSLDVIESVGVNVDEYLTAFGQFAWDKERKALLMGGTEAVRAAFRSWNEDTAQWLRETFVQAKKEGLAIGNLSDVGKARGENTLLGQLLKDKRRLRGRLIDTVSGTRHVSAETSALNIARIQMVDIENQAAEHEAKRVGLTHCYNANPTDSNTTRVCALATAAGVLTLAQMKKRYGVPPRLRWKGRNTYHLCRSLLVYVDPAWMD